MTLDGITVLLGTTKGAFLVDGNAARDAWSIRGPYCDNWPINHIIADPDNERTLQEH